MSGGSLTPTDDSLAHSQSEEDNGQELTALAPIEETSPLGYNVTFFNATLLNTSAMIGMGIFSTPSVILRSVGSVGMLLVLYAIVPLITWAGLVVYIELTSMCGHKRSGAEVVYLEEAYPRPRYLLATAFALTTALLSHAGVSSTVFAKHVLLALNAEVTPFKQRSLALIMVTCAVWVCLFSNKWALRVNGISAVFKMGSLLIIIITGFTCLFGWTAVPRTDNFKSPFEGSIYEANPLATSIVKVLYSYVGWNTILGLVAEVKGRNPIRTIRKAGAASLIITSTLFIATLVSFSVVLTKEEILGANEVLGALFFRKMYGNVAADKLFPVFIGFSTFGGIVSSTLYYARMLREAGRQGVLPFATFWSQVGRFKTPYGPVLLKWALACFMIIAIPAKDTFAFLIDLASYPALIFSLLVSCGVWILRRRRADLGLPEHAYKAPNFLVGLYVMQSVALLIMPWIPPKGGSHGGDVGFFYATYCIVAIMLLLLCGFYYWVRFYALPQWYGYELIEETVSLPGGVKTVVLTKVFKSRLEDDDESPLLREGQRV